MHRIKSAYLFTLALVLLSGCASMGLEAPASFEERLAYAVGQNASVRQAAANALTAGEISKEDAQRVLVITDQVRTALDAAKLADNVADAESRLAMAIGILNELQSYLRKRK